MPAVKINKKIKGNKDDVYKAVKSYLKEKKVLEKWGGNISWEDKKTKGHIEGKKFSGDLMVVEKGASSEVSISIKLSVWLSPFQSMVSDELKKHLGRVKV